MPIAELFQSMLRALHWGKTAAKVTILDTLDQVEAETPAEQTPPPTAPQAPAPAENPTEREQMVMKSLVKLDAQKSEFITEVSKGITDVIAKTNKLSSRATELTLEPFSTKFVANAEIWKTGLVARRDALGEELLAATQQVDSALAALRDTKGAMQTLNELHTSATTLVAELRDYESFYRQTATHARSGSEALLAFNTETGTNMEPATISLMITDAPLSAEAKETIQNLGKGLALLDQPTRTKIGAIVEIERQNQLVRAELYEQLSAAVSNFAAALPVLLP